MTARPSWLTAWKPLCSFSTAAQCLDPLPSRSRYCPPVGCWGLTAVSPGESSSTRGSYHLITGRWWDLQRSGPLPQSQTTLKGHPSSPCCPPSPLLQRFKFSLCSIPLHPTSFRDTFFWFTPNSFPVLKFEKQGLFLRNPV